MRFHERSFKLRRMGKNEDSSKAKFNQIEEDEEKKNPIHLRSEKPRRHRADFDAVPPPPLNGESDPHPDLRNPELTSPISTPIHHHHLTEMGLLEVKHGLL
nr:hypothetical protein CFP56_32991 [Quercus suber]